jgi:hypothetical protein
MARLATRLVVNALIRRVNSSGGSAMVLARGDPDAGGILVLTLTRGDDPLFWERGIGPSGNPALVAAGPRAFEDAQAVSDYWQRRRSRDADLWVVELDIADAQRFAAETMVFD